MGITVHPVDKVGTAPVYSGRNTRQAQSPFLGGATAARPLGARSGVRPGTPSSTISLSGTTWTLGRHAGVLDVIAAAEAGPYTYAVDSSGGGLPTGTLTAAHGTLPRVDILSLQLSDPAESTGGNPEVVTVYTTGSPGTATDPAAPDRSMPVARFNVPANGTGSPTVTWIAPTAVSAGGITPGTTTTAFGSGQYIGQCIDDPTLGLLRWNGTAWRRSADVTLGRASMPSSTVVAATPSWTTLATVTATTVGGPVLLRASAILANANSGATRTGSLRVAVDGAAVGSPAGLDVYLDYVASAEPQRSVAGDWQATGVAAGSHTFTVQANGSAGASVRAWNATLVVTEQP